MVHNSKKGTHVTQTGGGGNEVAIFAATLGKWLLLHPAAKYILYKRYNIQDDKWCSFPVLRLAQEMLGECRGRSIEVAIETVQTELDEMESNAQLDQMERGERVEGGGKSRSRRLYKRTSRKGRKSRKSRKSRKIRIT